jgi:uncharacterized phiE125 gp8 family phage protein
MALIRTTAPTTEPVTLSELKIDLRIDGIESDTTLNSYIKAARELAEDFQNRAFFTQTFELSFDSFPEMPVKLPRPPLQSLVSVKYIDENGAEVPMNLTDFIVDTRSEPGRIAFKKDKQWPNVKLQSIDSVIFRFTAGFSDANKVSEAVKDAIKIYAAYRYDNPDAEDIPKAFYNALWLNRGVPV